MDSKRECQHFYNLKKHRPLIASFSRQKTSERIINEFIFQNTGSIRKHGNDEVQKLITKHNIQKLRKISTASIVLRKFGGGEYKIKNIDRFPIHSFCILVYLKTTKQNSPTKP